jgi:carbonic anhydrase
MLGGGRGAASGVSGGTPAKALAVVTCMDCRIDPLASLGLGANDAHVLRNAGGVVTDDVIRSLAISQRRLGTRAVVLIHHTDCGMEKLSDEEFGAELERDAGVAPAFAIESFNDAETSVRESIRRVQDSPFLPHRDDVRGFVYEVESGRLRTVDGQRG